MAAKRRTDATSFRLEPDLLAQVAAAARAEGCTVTEWWRRAARQRLEYHEEVLERLRAANAVPPRGQP